MDSSRTFDHPHDYFVVSPKHRLRIAEALSASLTDETDEGEKSQLRDLIVRMSIPGSALVSYRVVMEFLGFIRRVEDLTSGQEVVVEQPPFGMVALSPDELEFRWLPYWAYGQPGSSEDHMLSYKVSDGIGGFAQFMQEELIRQHWLQTPERDQSMYVG